MPKSYNIIALFLLFLAKNKRYTTFKAQIREIFTNPKNIYKNYIDWTIIFFIVSSIAIMMYEVKYPVSPWLDFYAIYFTSIVFAIEYLIKFWIYNDIHKEILKEEQRATFLKIKPRYTPVLIRAFFKKISYIFTPFAIIDLLAILPMYRELRFLKIFILFRFLKIFQHSRNIHHFLEVLSERKFELITLLFILIFVVFVGGIAIYVLEDHLNSKINDLFDALYWSFITITTVGFGDIVPVTTAGRVVSFIIILIGITMLSFATSVIVSAFSEKLNELKEERLAEEIVTKEKFLILCGYSHITKVFLRLVQEKEKYDYIILDKDEAKVQEALNDGHNAICDDASRYEVLKRFYSPNADITILALTSSDVENIYITLNAKAVSKDIKVIARANSKKVFNRYKKVGADRVVLPNDIASAMLVASIAYPTTYKAINAILNFKEVATIDEVYIDNQSEFVGKTIQSIPFEKLKITVVGVQNGIDGVFKFNPKKEYLLKEGDVLVVLGHKISIEYLKEHFNLIGSYS